MTQPRKGRGKKEDEKILTMHPHPDPLPGMERGLAKGEKG
jgi:hypothetical protein